MAWVFKSQQVLPVVKVRGKCQKLSQWKFCPYWRAKHHPASGRILGYRCALFNEDKIGDSSLSACNAQYGMTYEGKP